MTIGLKSGPLPNLKSFTTMRNMISEKKIIYDNRTSLSDNKSSNGSSDDSPASVYGNNPNKVNMDEEDKKFFTRLSL